jgi:hypothetical protein
MKINQLLLPSTYSKVSLIVIPILVANCRSDVEYINLGTPESRPPSEGSPHFAGRQASGGSVG